MKIVMAEDDALIAYQIKYCIQRFGYDILGSLKEAFLTLEFTTKYRPDFVFMDVELNGPIGGIQCLTFLKTNFEVPSLFVNSYDETDVIEKATSLSPINFLLKPFTDKNIEAAVRPASIKLVKKVKITEDSVSSLREYTFNYDCNTLKLEDTIIKLIPNEIKLVFILFNTLCKTVSSEEIQRYIWEEKHIFSAAFSKLISRTNESLIGRNIAI